MAKLLSNALKDRYGDTLHKAVAIANMIIEDFVIENWQHDEQLPTLAYMATEANVNEKTIEAAIDILRRINAVRSSKGVGVFYRHPDYRDDDIPVPEKYVPWAVPPPFGNLEGMKLRREKSIFTSLEKYLQRAFSKRDHITYCVEGVEYNSTTFLQDLFELECGIKAEREEISYMQDEIAVLNILLKNFYCEDAIFVVTEPGCEDIKEVAEAQGYKVITVAVDKDGMNISELEKICKEYKVTVVLSSPRVQLPYTVMLSKDRRKKLVELKGKCKFELIEYDHFIQSTTAPYLPLAAEYPDAGITYVRQLSPFNSWLSRAVAFTGSKELIKKCWKDQGSYGTMLTHAQIETIVEVWDTKEFKALVNKALRILEKEMERVMNVLKKKKMIQYVRRSSFQNSCFYFDAYWLKKRFFIADFVNMALTDEELEAYITATFVDSKSW